MSYFDTYVSLAYNIKPAHVEAHSYFYPTESLLYDFFTELLDGRVPRGFSS